MAEADRFSALDSLLDRIHAAVRAGDLTALDPLAEALEAAATSPYAVPEAETAALRLKAQRNAACLDAAARGLRAAQRRLREITSAAAGGSVYDDRGRAQAMASTQGRITARL